MTTKSVSYHCAPDLARLLELAEEMAETCRSERIGVEHVFLAILRSPDTIPVEELRAMGLEADIVLMRLAQFTQLPYIDNPT
ncbi:Clp protease N-terminal domain-containing protein [Nocardia sp. NPDC004722]